MLKQLERLLGESSPQATIATAVGLCAGVLFLDFLTGAELAFSLFYVIPVALLVWFVGVPAAMVAAGLGATLGLLLDLNSDATFSHPIVPYWNALATVALYLAAVVLLRVLKRALAEEKALARTDGLTEVANRRRFFEAAEMELARSFRYKHPFTIVYVDVDDFKTLNDRFGHGRGDEVLRAFAAVINETARYSDLVARLGGDEFGVLLPETEAAGAERFLTRLRDRLRNEPWLDATASIGAVTFLDAPRSIEDMVAAADSLMYDVKRAGKNGVRQRIVGDSLSLDRSPEAVVEISSA